MAADEITRLQENVTKQQGQGKDMKDASLIDAFVKDISHQIAETDQLIDELPDYYSATEIPSLDEQQARLQQLDECVERVRQRRQEVVAKLTRITDGYLRIGR